MSPRAGAVVARLRYVNDYVFGGNTKAFAIATGFGYNWLRRILEEHSRVRISTIVQFAESGIVAPEWLLCGTGPMFKDANCADLPALPVVIKNRQVLFDTSSVGPLAAPAFKLSPVNKRVPPALVNEFVPLAQSIHGAHVANGPVILYVDESTIKAGTSLLVMQLLKTKIVTHVIMPTAAALADTLAAQIVPDIATVNSSIQLAANSGVGLADGLGRWAFRRTDDATRSILASAYGNGFHISVLANFGDCQLYANPALAGAQFGAALGAASYIDFLAFVKNVQAADKVGGVFINAGGADGLAKLETALSACNRTPGRTDFSKLRTAHLAPTAIAQRTDYAFTGSYSVLLAAILRSCSLVYEGKHYDKNGNRKNSVAD